MSASDTGHRRVRPGILSLILLTVAAIYFFLRIQPPADTIFLIEMRDVGHALVFALLALATLWVLRTHLPGPVTRHPAASYGIALLFCIFLGVITELAQILSATRNPNIGDLLRDIAGASGALGLVSLTDYRLRIRHSLAVRGLVALVAGIALTWGLEPLIGWSASYMHRNQQFPVLEDFTPRWSPSFLLTSNAILQRVPADQIAELPTDSPWPHMGRIEFTDGRWPSLTVREPIADWSQFKVLVLEVFNPSNEQRFLNIRIDDKLHSGQFEDRFNRSYDIAPGTTTIRIPLAAIADGPVHRKLDITRIAKLIVFASQPEKPFVLYFSPIRLE